MFHYIIVLLQIIFEIFIHMVSSENLEANLAGFIHDCIGTNVYKELPQEEIKYITISVVHDDKDCNSSTYNYYQVEELAKDPYADFEKPTVMFVSGYLDKPGSPMQTNISLVYRQLGFTVLLLNARVFTIKDYFSACRGVRPVGKHTAEMLANLTKHGLDLTGVKVSRITGLDPAGPCFRDLEPKDRLHSSDADFVDVIKTNIYDYGMVEPNGHINFYINGGAYQPGNEEKCEITCSHERSYYLWIAALFYPNNFIAIKCDSVQEAINSDCYKHKPLDTNVLGLNTDKNNQGIFYLRTTGEYPYYLGDEGLKKPAMSEIDSTKGSVLIIAKSII